MQRGRITYDDMLSRPQTALQTCPRPALAHIPWNPQTTSNSFNESQQGFPRPGFLDWINRNVCDKFQFLPHRANPKLRCMRLIQEEPRNRCALAVGQRPGREIQRAFKWPLQRLQSPNTQQNQKNTGQGPTPIISNKSQLLHSCLLTCRQGANEEQRTANPTNDAFGPRLRGPVDFLDQVAIACNALNCNSSTFCTAEVFHAQQVWKHDSGEIFSGNCLRRIISSFTRPSWSINCLRRHTEPPPPECRCLDPALYRSTGLAHCMFAWNHEMERNTMN